MLFPAVPAVWEEHTESIFVGWWFFKLFTVISVLFSKQSGTPNKEGYDGNSTKHPWKVYHCVCHISPIPLRSNHGLVENLHIFGTMLGLLKNDADGTTSGFWPVAHIGHLANSISTSGGPPGLASHAGATTHLVVASLVLHLVVSHLIVSHLVASHLVAVHLVPAIAAITAVP